MAITKEQWKAIEVELRRPYGKVEMKCGERSVIFSVRQVKPLKFAIVTYVDGEWRGEWLKEESELGKLFLNRRERFCHSPKARADYIKAMGGKRCPKKHRDLAEAKFAYHDPCWSSPTPLRRHYRTMHPDAELVSVGHVAREDNSSPLNALKDTLASMGLYEGERA